MKNANGPSCARESCPRCLKRPATTSPTTTRKTIHPFPDTTAWHTRTMGSAWESFVIGSAAARADVELALTHIPTPEGRQAFLAARQERDRTSLNEIGETAYEMARRYRKSLALDQPATGGDAE